MKCKVLFLTLGMMGLAAATAYAADTTVSQFKKKFSEESVEVAVGDTVTFTNEEKRTKHNIIIKSLGFNSGKQGPGEDVSLEILEPGEHMVRCGIHPKMKMTIVAK